jgi:hypothetical protein
MLLLSNCNEEEPDTLSVSPAGFSFTADDTKEEIATVTTNVDTWIAEVSDSWVTVRKEGNELRISVQKYNGTSAPRQANIHVAAGTADPVTVSVTQARFGVPDGNYSGGGWNGQIINDPSGRFFTITNFENTSINVRCLYKNGKIIIDEETRVAEDLTNKADGYFRAGTVNGNTFTIYGSSNEYAVNYNSSTRVLDFSGTINGRTAVVGIVAFSKSTGNPIGFFTDLYANLKLTLTSTSSAPQFSGNAIVTAGDTKEYKVRETSILEMTNNTAGSSGKKHIIIKESLKK